MQNVTLIGIDLYKHFFHVHCQDKSGQGLQHKRFTRTKLMDFMLTCPPSVIVIEAFAMANTLAWIAWAVTKNRNNYQA